MALNTNPFIEGIDPTSTFGGYASVLLQLVREAYPSSTYGMVLFDTTAPDVLGSNAWRKTCIWLDLTNPNIPTVNVYKEGTSPGWVNVNNIIGNGAITTAMIANGAVTLPKLSVSGGAALQLIRVNATNAAFEFVSLASLVTVGSIPVGSLITTGIPPGELRFAGVFGPTTANWIQPIQIINALVDGSINPDLLGVPGALTSRSQFLTARTADTFANYRYFEPNVDILAAAMNGNRLTDFTTSVSKISPGAATEGSYLRIVGGVPDWDPAPTSGITTKFVTDLASLLLIPLLAGNSVILPHALGQVPLSFRISFICIQLVGSIGYAFLDEIDAMTVTGYAGANSGAAFTYYVTSTGIKVTKNFNYNLYVADNTIPGPAVVLPEADWRLRLYATYTT